MSLCLSLRLLSNRSLFLYSRLLFRQVSFQKYTVLLCNTCVVHFNGLIPQVSFHKNTYFLVCAQQRIIAVFVLVLEHRGNCVDNCDGIGTLRYDGDGIGTGNCCGIDNCDGIGTLRYNEMMAMELARVIVLALELCCGGNCRLHCVGIGILHCPFL